MKRQVSAKGTCLSNIGGPTRTRTWDLPVMSRRLYQLSYRPTKEANYSRKDARRSSPSGACSLSVRTECFRQAKEHWGEKGEVCFCQSKRRGTVAPGGAGCGRCGISYGAVFSMQSAKTNGAARIHGQPRKQAGIAAGRYMAPPALSLLICSSMAFFRGAGRPMMSTLRKPRTMVEVASSSSRPRAMRYSISS